MMQQTLKEYGKKLGFKNLSFNQNQVVHLTIQDLGELYLEESAHNLLIYLARSYDSIDVKFLQRALQLCHYKQKNAFPTSVGMVNENICSFLIRLPMNEVREQNIHEAVQSLAKMHDKMLRTGH